MRKAVFIAMALLLVAVAAPAAITTVDAPVADAVMKHDATRLKALLRQGADVNAAQGDGMTALHWAAMAGDAETVTMLVAAGARLEAVTRNGSYAPLHLAARSGSVAAVKVLLDAGANVKSATSSGGTTPLHFAASLGDKAIVAALLDKGAPVDAKETAFGQTPIMWAAAYDRTAAVELLAARGANLKLTSKVEDVPAREKLDRAALTLRTRKVAAVKAAEAPPAPAGRGAGTAPVTAEDSAQAKKAAAAPIAATGPRGGGADVSRRRRRRGHRHHLVLHAADGGGRGRRGDLRHQPRPSRPAQGQTRPRQRLPPQRQRQSSAGLDRERRMHAE